MPFLCLLLVLARGASAAPYVIVQGSDLYCYLGAQLDMIPDFPGRDDVAAFNGLTLSYDYARPGERKEAFGDMLEALVSDSPAAMERLRAAGLPPESRLSKLIERHRDELRAAAASNPRLAQAMRETVEKASPPSIPEPGTALPEKFVREAAELSAPKDGPVRP